MKRIVSSVGATLFVLGALGASAGAFSPSVPTYMTSKITPAPTASPEPELADPAEPAESMDAPEPTGAAGVGHADDTADPNADHQFDGEE